MTTGRQSGMGALTREDGGVRESGFEQDVINVAAGEYAFLTNELKR